VPLSALAHAALDGEQHLAQIALAAGADPNERTACGETPILLALRPYIPEVDADRQFETARRVRKLKIADALIAAGANVGTADYYGMTPLHAIASTSMEDAVVEQWISRLLELGAEVDARTRSGVTPLMNATRAKHLGAVKRLLAAGADPSARSNDGLNPGVDCRCERRRSAAELARHAALRVTLGHVVIVRRGRDLAFDS
jgi:ankyrin repeat protein